MIHVLADKDKLTGFLLKLTQLVEERRVLIVIDNAESLLSETGQWRDDEWGQVVGALCRHAGHGRLVLTSRRVPATGTVGLLVESVDALSADEALLLSRELPHLDRLIRGELPGVDRDVSRSLALGVLNIAQGHPKLLELADGQAGVPEQLAGLVAVGDAAWREAGGLPDGFFTTLETTASAGDYLHVLAVWTEAVSGVLSEAGRILFWSLCCLEEPDRELSVLDGNWGGLWAQLGMDGQPPALDRTLTEVAARGLVAVRRENSGAGESYAVHRAFNPDPSRANAAAILPAIREIADHDARESGMLAMVLGVLDPAAGERQMRAYLDAVVAVGDYRAASVAAGRLVYLCHGSGRLAEALTLAEQQIGYTRQAGLGPWTQLLDEVRRLQMLNEMGQAARVLAEVQRLRDRMQTLPAAVGPDETAAPWNVREMLLDTGSDAAILLGRWQDALDLNAEQITSLRGHSAPAAAIALARFGDYAPLLRLGRTGEALALLLECRQVFQDAGYILGLAAVLNALADTENERGHGGAAIGMARDALRYSYLAGYMIGIAVSYHNLGGYLADHARQHATALACHLAAALIRALTGAEGAERSVREAATKLRALGAEDARGPACVTASGPGGPGTDAILPADVSALCRMVGDIPGTDLAGLLTVLAPDPATADQTLRDLTTQAKILAAAPPETI